MHKKLTYQSCAMLLVAMLIAACSSNNCPLESSVYCNYYFYDSEGNAISFSEPFTVKTLLPGQKTVYTYRKLGETTVTKERRDTLLIDQGYTESVSVSRRDTILVNKTSNSFIEVPMSYLNKVDTLIFDYTNITRNDTLYVHHDSYAHVELPECGVHYYHNLKSIETTDAAIYNIEISNPKVTFEGLENVKIYFNGVAE